MSDRRSTAALLVAFTVLNLVAVALLAYALWFFWLGFVGIALVRRPARTLAGAR